MINNHSSFIITLLTRKINKLQKEPHRLPDLMIIDGGKGHMSVVQQVLQKSHYLLDINSLYFPFHL